MQSPAILSSSHHSQKMLVMSESRLKIQISSGAEIRTNDQDTPFSDCRILAIKPGLTPLRARSFRASSIKMTGRDIFNTTTH
ncbi:hypothetical protein F7725_005196 [Dissostichus mawsoni]|uniref:Uncharacterized protein n=1 Tax=Dissostichus mawsoni TaxID=36200 RepID=A0A7J5YSD2_DISMA|nr:hypothetical protein F7725_005196 [Dissostichus mawsoni]